jgi:hypothetical protein
MYIAMLDGTGAPTRKVAPEKKLFWGQQILGRLRRRDAQFGRVDILYLGADRGISVDAVCSPTSLHCAERCCSVTGGAMAQRREQPHRPPL